MDPLSITASITAILKLASEVTQYLFDVRNAPRECHSCTTEILNLLPLLHGLRDRVERAQDGDLWAEQLRRLSFPGGPLDQYKQALDLLLSKVDAGEGMAKVKKRLLWKFSREEVASIQGRIERLKSLISIALSMDHMALSEAIRADTSTLQITTRSIQTDTENIRDAAYSIQTNAKIIRDTQAQEQYRTVLEWLSSTDYSAQQHNILSRRQEGTAQWFLDSPEFGQWIQGLEKTLFCPGMPGAGKTMMAAVTIDYLSRTYDTNDVNIAYIFCSYQAQIDQSASSLIAAILKQLAPNSPDALTMLTGLYNRNSKRGSRPALNKLLELIVTCVNRTTTYIIVDALDECSTRDGTRDQLIKTLLDLQAKSDVRLLFTSRFKPRVMDKFRSNPQLEVQASKADVRRFVDGQIPSLEEFIQRDEALQREIRNEIADAVDGMFLLAVLHMDSVRNGGFNRRQLRQILANLPKGLEALSDAYDQTLARIDAQPPEHRDLAKRALYWVSYAERQLVANELRVALAVEPGRTALEADNMTDLDVIVSFCAGLITVDQESNVVRLVHYTTQEYLLQRVQHTWAPDVQHKIAEACLTYLSFDEFRNGACTSDTLFEERLIRHEFFDYTARFWSHHVCPVEQSVVEIAAKILRDKASLSSIVQVNYTLDLNYRGYSLEYPSTFTALHLVAHVGLCNLLQHLLTCEVDSNKKIDQIDSSRRRPLYYASQRGHEQMVKLLLDRGADINAQSGDHGTALSAASKYGHEQVVKLLLDQGADVNAQGGIFGTALIAASSEGHEQVVKLLLDRGADINAPGGTYGTALSEASMGGHEQVVKLLLDQGADVNAQSGDHGTALYAASECGHEQVVKLLLNQGADVNVQGGLYSTALCAASDGGHEQAVKLLLDHGADVNAQGGDHGTALNAASDGGHEQVVKLLLDHGADVNVQGGFYGTALCAASGQGHEQVAKLLLDQGADVNAQAGMYSAALCAASSRGHEQVVKLLLDHGADVNAQSGMYSAALYAASKYGHEQVVKLLLDHGADVNAQGGMYSAALCAASSRGHEQVVKLLLDQGADVNAQSGMYSAALYEASAHGHEQVVKLLLDQGADVNAQREDYGTALHGASTHGHEQVVKLLRGRGAIPT